MSMINMIKIPRKVARQRVRRDQSLGAIAVGQSKPLYIKGYHHYGRYVQIGSSHDVHTGAEIDWATD